MSSGGPQKHFEVGYDLLIRCLPRSLRNIRVARSGSGLPRAPRTTDPDRDPSTPESSESLTPGCIEPSKLLTPGRDGPAPPGPSPGPGRATPRRNGIRHAILGGESGCAGLRRQSFLALAFAVARGPLSFGPFGPTGRRWPAARGPANHGCPNQQAVLQVGPPRGTGAHRRAVGPSRTGGQY